ncbi:MAG: Ku protein [Carbonactinosporaceae bacterium]
MRAIWKGAISFGLVTIPVRLYSATQERDVRFHQVHEKDGSRIRFRRFCEKEDREVPYAEIAKGYEMSTGEMVILTEDDFQHLPLASSKTIEVLKFVPLDQVDSIYLSRNYYLGADGPGEKPYVLLRDALARSGQVAVVKVALRSREALAILRAFGDVLLVQTMLWPDEVRDAAELAPPGEVTIRAQEISMAESYIDTLSGDFTPEEYQDDYRRALEELIDAKATGREVEAPVEEAGEARVADLMSALRASVEAAKQSRQAGSRQGAARRGKPARAKAGTADGDEPKAARKTPDKPAKKRPKKSA